MMNPVPGFSPKPVPAVIGRYRKAWAAFAAGAAVFLASGLITGSVAAWISTAISAVTVSLVTATAKANDPKDPTSAVHSDQLRPDTSASV